jgi:hypothetical protein
MNITGMPPSDKLPIFFLKPNMTPNTRQDPRDYASRFSRETSAASEHALSIIKKSFGEKKENSKSKVGSFTLDIAMSFT